MKFVEHSASLRRVFGEAPAVPNIARETWMWIAGNAGIKDPEAFKWDIKQI